MPSAYSQKTSVAVGCVGVSTVAVGGLLTNYSDDQQSCASLAVLLCLAEYLTASDAATGWHVYVSPSNRISRIYY